MANEWPFLSEPFGYDTLRFVNGADKSPWDGIASRAGTPSMPLAPMSLGGPPGQGGLDSSSAVNGASTFGTGGISGGIGSNAGGVDAGFGFTYPGNGSMDGLDYQFLNNFLGGGQQPERSVNPSFGGPSDTVAPNFSGPSQGQAQSQLGYGSYDTYVSPSYYGSLPSPEKYADANGVINTRVAGYQPSMLEDFGGYFQGKYDRLTSTPDSFSVGNGIQMATRALGPTGTLLSGILGLAGVGSGSTGNSVLDMLATPSFGLGMPDASKSGVLTDRGATAFNPAMYSTPAEQSLAKAYSSTASYGPSGWVDGASPASTAAMAAPTDFGGTFGNGEFQQWYPDNTNLFSLTGNMLENANWGPGTKYVMNPFDTN